jgi:hypothetical protein
MKIPVEIENIIPANWNFPLKLKFAPRKFQKKMLRSSKLCLRLVELMLQADLKSSEYRDSSKKSIFFSKMEVR